MGKIGKKYQFKLTHCVSHQTYKRHKAATKDTHRNGSSLLTNGHAKAENHAHKKLRAD